jgi:type I restriction enzyme S subunit
LKWAFEGKLTNDNVKDGELPAGWETLKIKDICEIKGGKNQSKVINPNGKYPIYGSSGIFGYADEYICDENTTIVGRKGNINSPLFDTTTLLNLDTAVGLCVNEKYDSKLLFYFCLGFNFKNLDKSTTIPSLAKTDIQSIDIQVPPLEEHHRIVQEIESRLSVADKMEESITESLQQAEALRQSILKKAFSGELV